MKARPPAAWRLTADSDCQPLVDGCRGQSCQDPQALLRGLQVLVTLNTLLASAVFVGLSVASPGPDDSTSQTPVQPLGWPSNTSANATSTTNGTTVIGPSLLLHVNSTTAQEKAAGSAREAPSAQKDPLCKGDPSKKQKLLARQMTAFVFLVGSCGIATGLLLSLDPECEMDTHLQRFACWFPYVVSGFCMLIGTGALLASLITLVEGPWHMWVSCHSGFALGMPGAPGGMFGGVGLLQGFIAVEAVFLGIGMLAWLAGVTIK